MEWAKWKERGIRLARRRVTQVVAIVVAVGLVRLPVERNLLRGLQEDGFHPRYEQIDMVDQLGVQSFIGILGGLRYMVATFFTVQSVELWENQKWDELAEKYRLISLLQPLDAESWSTGAWHLAYNASAWYRLDDRQHTPEEREVLARRFIQRGKSMLQEGIRWNPEEPDLYRDLANIHREKEGDLCAAAEVYKEASRLEAAPSFMFRFYGYFLADCPGREEEAYGVLREIYEEGERVFEAGGPLIWKPTLIVKLREVEERLDVPGEERIEDFFDEERLRIVTPRWGYRLAASGDPDEAREAYELLSRVHEHGREQFTEKGLNLWKPQTIRTLRELEDRLNVPEAERIPERVDPATGEVIPGERAL